MAENIEIFTLWIQRFFFVGHNVTSSGIGWIISPQAEREGAFGHDAWTFNHRLAGVKWGAKMHERAKLSACISKGRKQHSSDGYAAARLEARQKARGSYPLGSVQQLAAAFKLEFVNTSMNCYWPGKYWESALADQRAYALLLAKQRHAIVDECSIWGSLYNQVHVTWKGPEIEAIFYVNDTITALRGSRPNALLRVARGSASRAYLDALRAQERLKERAGRIVPIVQYRVSNEECFDGKPLARRLRLAREKGMRHPGISLKVFHIPNQ